MSAIKDNQVQKMLEAIEEPHPGFLEAFKETTKAMLEVFGDVDVVVLPSSLSYEEKEIYCIAYYLKKGLSIEEAEKEAKLLLSIETQESEKKGGVRKCG